MFNSCPTLLGRNKRTVHDVKVSTCYLFERAGLNKRTVYDVTDPACYLCDHERAGLNKPNAQCPVNIFTSSVPILRMFTRKSKDSGKTSLKRLLTSSFIRSILLNIFLNPTNVFPVKPNCFFSRER